MAGLATEADFQYRIFLPYTVLPLFCTRGGSCGGNDFLKLESHWKNYLLFPICS